MIFIVRGDFLDLVLHRCRRIDSRSVDKGLRLNEVSQLPLCPPSTLALRQQTLQISGLGEFKDAAFHFDCSGVDGPADLSFNPKPISVTLCRQYLEVCTRMLDPLDSGWAPYPSRRSNEGIQAPDVA